MSGLCPTDFRSDFSFPSLNVYSEWGLAGHFGWTCSLPCSPGDKTQAKLLSFRLQFPRWPRSILGFKDSGKALPISSFHSENGLGPTGLRKLSLSQLLALWPVLVRRRQSSIQGCPLGLCLPSSDKLSVLLDGANLYRCLAHEGNATLNCPGFLGSLLAITKHRR